MPLADGFRTNGSHALLTVTWNKVPVFAHGPKFATRDTHVFVWEDIRDGILSWGLQTNSTGQKPKVCTPMTV